VNDHHNRDGYSIGDLARLADVTPRTVRYYVAQGLLPSPGTQGPASRYDDGHLARLRLIRRLQRRHLPLAEIRRQLAGLSDTEVRSALDEADRPDPRPAASGSALDYVRGLLRPTTEPRAQPPGRPMRVFSQLSTLQPSGRLVDAGGTRRPPPGMPLGVAEPRPVSPVLPAPPPDRSQWERISLAPDIELHIRRPLSRPVNKRVERLVAFARSILEEDQP
jgi:DNA-binding transcriptional MerR regulator